ncbi:MAG TPA: cyanophycinase [Thermoanaerobaculia bacterium]|nr:cyanophycinase [Thermoanaerobaculia bacterium]
MAIFSAPAGLQTGQARPGLLMAIGGAEDKIRERVILRAFVEAAGGPDANLVVMATASELAETGDRYVSVFESLHADTVEVLRVRSREDALQGDASGSGMLDLLEFASGLFITGGSQLRISAALGGTALADTIRRRHAEGMVVAGTSAGAAVLSEHMIAMGDSGGTPRRRLVQMAQGLGLAPELVIDQHFRQRDRLGRLVTALSYNPGPLGIGVDEDTAAMIDGGVLRVIGSGAVTVLDASTFRYTDSPEVRRGQALAMLGLKLDFLTSGCRYDLRSRTGLPPLSERPLLQEEETAEVVR